MITTFLKPAPSIHDHQGRISKFLIFETSNHLLPYDNDEKIVFAALREKYRPLIKGFHDVDPNKEFVIFFSCSKHGNYPQPWHDSKRKTWFFPIVTSKRSPALPSRWVQDIIVFAGSGLLGFNSSLVSRDLASVLAEKLRLPDYDFLPGYMQGGNILTGTFGEKRFLLIGKTTTEQQEHADMRRILRQKYLLNCYDKATMGKLQKIFFHLDYYTALVGGISGNECNVYLLQIFFDPGKSLNSIRPEGDIVKLPQQAGTNPDPKLNFVAIKVPIVIFRRPAAVKKDKNWEQGISDNDIDLVLSYANCHVENYMDGKKNIIRIFMPDFSDAVIRFYESRLKWDEYQEAFADGLEMLEHNFSLWKKSGPSSPRSRKFFGKQEVYDVNFIRDLFTDIQEYTREYIKKELGDKTFNRKVSVIFIPHAFYELARRSGSLHCMSKVLERDI
ncbi:MAG: hypothetical protein FD123_1684 [Bacteroidetes bacterium]|nr:MAG: hypothetical protein FD123_1684 [Bacteroidota bacterium]